MGNDTVVNQKNTVLGVEYSPDSAPPEFGDDSLIRSGCIIYNDVTTGDGFATGHSVLVREQTVIGDSVLVGTRTTIDGYSVIGHNTSIQTGVYIPRETDIGENVFIGPHATLLNDPYPARVDTDLQGPEIADHVSIGGNATILPDVSIGERSFVAAGAVVTADIPPETLAVGVPAGHRPLPEHLQSDNEL